MDHGSGFPTNTSKHLSQMDMIYAESEWNLNNLPIVPNSILKHIDMDISGEISRNISHVSSVFISL